MDESRIRRGRKPSGPLPMPTIKMPPREDAILVLDDAEHERGDLLKIVSYADADQPMKFAIGSRFNRAVVMLSKDQVAELIEFLQLRTGTWR